MSLDIAKLVSNAMSIATGLVPGAFVDAVIRGGATNGPYDPITDKRTSTWDFELPVKVLEFNDKKSKDSADGIESDKKPNTKIMKYLVNGIDVTQITADSELVIGEKIWTILNASRDPSRSLVIIETRAT